MSMPDPSPLKPQDAVMYALGELKGQMNAVLASQTAQAEVNAENKREHEEFRSHLGAHDAAFAVIDSEKTVTSKSRGEVLRGIGLAIAAAGAIGSVIVSILFH